MKLALAEADPEEDQDETRPVVSGPPIDSRIASWRKELEEFHRMMRVFRSLPPEEVFMQLSGMLARLGEIRMDCLDTPQNGCARFRTQYVDKTIDAISLQFKIYSRVYAVVSDEMRLSGRTT